MKKIWMFLCVLAGFHTVAQQQIRLGSSSEPDSIQQGIQNNQSVPFFRFKGLMNAQKPEASINELKGKIVILEFWATWCGPCIPAITHLDAIQKNYPDQVQVVAISDETPERIERFIKNKPNSLWFLSDPDHSMQTYFPYQAIPHSVIIDQTGKLVINTSPDQITKEVIDKLLQNKTVSIKEKKDAYSGFDFMKDYFPKPAGFNDYSFEIQPKIPGGFPIGKRYAPNNEWYGRRVTMINNSLDLIYRNIYNTTIPRLVYEGVSKEMFDPKNSEQYCIDVIVPKGKEAELSRYMQEQIKKLDLPYKARIEIRQVECYVFTVADPSVLESLRSKASKGNNTASNQPMIIRATNYNKKNVPLNDLFNHFEQFGILKIPIVDETRLSGTFDLTFEFDAENPNSFKNELSKLGLKAERKTKDIEMLVIYKD